jgi:hypothetical protein
MARRVSATVKFFMVTSWLVADTVASVQPVTRKALSSNTVALFFFSGYDGM